MATGLPSVARTLFRTASVISRRGFCSTTPRWAVYTVQDQEEFEKKVLQSGKPVIVDFYADWCGPCKILEPRMQRVICSKGDRVDLAKINIDDNAELAMEYGVSAVPAVLGVVNGKVKDKFVGLLDEDRIDSFVEQCIGPECAKK